MGENIVSAPPGENWFSITRSFDAPRRLVYKCYTEPQHMAHFWGPRETTLAECRIDLRVGGVWKVRWQYPDGKSWGYASVYLGIVPDSELHYRDAPNDWIFGLDGLPPLELDSTIALADSGRGTTVTVTVRCVSMEARDETVRRGFAGMVSIGHDRLAEYLATIDPQRFEESIMPFVTSKDGTRIGYSMIGAGPALILVDGAMCWRASGPMTPLADKLKDSFSVYTYDRRGRGESGDTKPYAVEREVDDLAAVLDAAGGMAAIYAISSGVGLALAAANAGLPISKMVLYEFPILTDDSRHVDASYARIMDELIAKGDNAGAIRHFMKVGVGVPGFAMFMMGLMGMFRKLAPVGPTLAYDTRLVTPYWTNRAPPASTWHNVTVPVLDIGGGKSDAWMQNAQLALSKALPNAVHKTLPGQNHMVAPDAIAPLIKEFLAA